MHYIFVGGGGGGVRTLEARDAMLLGTRHLRWHTTT